MESECAHPKTFVFHGKLRDFVEDMEKAIKEVGIAEDNLSDLIDGTHSMRLSALKELKLLAGEWTLVSINPFTLRRIGVMPDIHALLDICPSLPIYGLSPRWIDLDKNAELCISDDSYDIVLNHHSGYVAIHEGIKHLREVCATWKISVVMGEGLKSDLEKWIERFTERELKYLDAHKEILSLQWGSIE